MSIGWSGLAPELLLALDRRSGDPLHPRGSLSLSRSLIVAGLVDRTIASGDQTPDLGADKRPPMPQIACAATRICSDPLPCYSRLINSRPCQLGGADGLTSRSSRKGSADLMTETVHG